MTRSRSLFIVALLALTALARVLPASAAATPPESLPAAALESAVIQRTAQGLGCQTAPVITLTDPQYRIDCAIGKSTLSISLERFTTAKDAAAVFAKTFPTTPTEREQVFHGYRAATAQTSTGDTSTRVHGWVADRWLVIAEVTAPSAPIKAPAPLSLSETLYRAAVSYKLFP